MSGRRKSAWLAGRYRYSGFQRSPCGCFCCRGWLTPTRDLDWLFERQYGEGAGSLPLSEPGTCGFPGKKQQVTPTCCCQDCAATSAVSWRSWRSATGRVLSVLGPVQVNLYHCLPGPGHHRAKMSLPTRIKWPHLNSLFRPVLAFPRHVSVQLHCFPLPFVNCSRQSIGIHLVLVNMVGGGIRRQVLFAVLWITTLLLPYLASNTCLPWFGVHICCLPELRPACVLHHMHYQSHSDGIAALLPLKPLVSCFNFNLKCVPAFNAESAQATCMFCCAAVRPVFVPS